MQQTRSVPKASVLVPLLSIGTSGTLFRPNKQYRQTKTAFKSEAGQK